MKCPKCEGEMEEGFTTDHVMRRVELPILVLWNLSAHVLGRARTQKTRQLLRADDAVHRVWLPRVVRQVAARAALRRLSQG